MMKRILRIILEPDFVPLLIVVFIAMLAGRSLIFESGYFNMHDDLQMMRQLQLEKCFADGQIPCRWVPDMGYGYGYPLFNFYPQLPYLIGQMFRVVGLSFVSTVKLTFAMTFILSGIFMYLLGKNFFGRIGGILSAIFYIWAPYFAVDVYVRGAMNEAWALVWYPAIFWASYKLVESKRQEVKGKRKEIQSIAFSKKILRRVQEDRGWIIVLALFWFGLLNSHNLMVMIIAPFFLVWLLILTWQKGAWQKIYSLAVSGLWALGLSAFFTLPVLFEQKYTWVEKITEGYYSYTVHFVTIRQLLFSRFWGYGPSVWLDEDGMSFQAGHLHWMLSLVVGLGIILFLFSKRKNIFEVIRKNKFILPTTFLIAVGWFSAFMTHSRSTPIWLAVEPMQFLQFPWRFLTLTIFAFAFVVGAIPALFDAINEKRNVVIRLASKWFQTSLVILLSLVLIGWNWNYFTPEYGRMGPLADEEKFSDEAWDKLQTAGIFDYLPLTAQTAPKAARTDLAEVVEGEGTILTSESGTYWGKFDADITSDEALVRVNIMDFPNWRVFSMNEEIEHFMPEDEEWGRMYIRLPQGEHFIYTQLFNTQIRTISNIISAFSWVVLLITIFFLIKTNPTKTSKDQS